MLRRHVCAPSTPTDVVAHAPLFHGPCDIAATARKYMITLREAEESEHVGNKRKSSAVVSSTPLLLCSSLLLPEANPAG